MTTLMSPLSATLALISAIVSGDFDLEFAGPSVLHVTPLGGAWNASYDCVLESSGDGPGVEAWSISLTADRARIAEITLEGTDAESLGPLVYQKAELTADGSDECSGREGAMSAVVLSVPDGVTLPRPGASTIARVRVEGDVPEGGGSAVLRYADGCRSSGQPIRNVVTVLGQSVRPAKHELETALAQVESCCSAQLNFGFSTENVLSNEPYSGVIDDGSGTCSGAGGRIEIPAKPGSQAQADVFVVLSSADASDGARGWSISIALDGDLSFGGGVSDADTAAAQLFDGGFRKSEVVDPARNRGQRGAVSAVLLSFAAVSLPSFSTVAILRMGMEPAQPFGKPSAEGGLRFQDGLQGSGQPVQTTISVSGVTNLACNQRSVEVSITFRACDLPSSGRFVRGDANNDARVDITDAVFTLSWLALGGPASLCAAWADADDDGVVNITDPIYTLNYLFLGGSAPHAPYPECGESPERCDALRCAANQAACKG